MTKDEAMAAIRARAPLASFEEEARHFPQPHEQVAYRLSKWTRKNGTDEELAALGIIR